MNAKKVCVLAGAALGAGLLTATVLLWNENRELRREQEALRAAIGADKRAVAFVYPAVQAGSGSSTQVVIRTTLMEVPPEVWGQLGLADLKTDPQLASQSGLVSQQQAESLIASLTSQTNCLILNRPVIQTSDGEQASLFVGEVTASNQQKGLSLDCLPQLGPDGRTVQLTLGMKFDPPGAAGN